MTGSGDGTSEMAVGTLRVNAVFRFLSSRRLLPLSPASLESGDVRVVATYRFNEESRGSDSSMNEGRKKGRRWKDRGMEDRMKRVSERNL